MINCQWPWPPRLHKLASYLASSILSLLLALAC